MNKLLILAIALLLCCNLQAQQQDIRFGIQLSPTFGWMNTNEKLINSNGTNLGLKLGMLGEVYFRENYAFSTGIGFFFNAGGTLFYEENIDTLAVWSEVDLPDNNNVFPGGTGLKYSLQYVEIPFGLKLRTREFGYIRYYLQPELTLGFRTQARGQVENVSRIDPGEKYDIKSATNLFNFSWGIGGGIEYSISENTALLGGIAFQSGFADVTKDKNTRLLVNGRDSKDNSKGKVNGLILRLGVMF